MLIIKYQKVMVVFRLESGAQGDGWRDWIQDHKVVSELQDFLTSDPVISPLPAGFVGN